MSVKTSIEWAERVLNPWTGCTEVSPGCDHCYAKTFAERWRGVPGHAFENGFDLTMHMDRLEGLLRLRKPSRFFVNSMSDLFLRDVTDDAIAKLYLAMEATPKHEFLLLTKRPERMRRFVPKWYDEQFRRWGRNELKRLQRPLPNVWHGVSIESNAYAWRADMLRGTPNAVPWISFEPLLASCAAVDLTGIKWVVIGGESGAGARPMDLDWVREIIVNARAVGAAVFVKQLGSVWSRAYSGPSAWRMDSKGGNIHRFPDDLRIREYPTLTTAEGLAS